MNSDIQVPDGGHGGRERLPEVGVGATGEPPAYVVAPANACDSGVGTGTPRSTGESLMSAQGMVLLVSDALAFTDPAKITSSGRDVVVKALRRSLHSDVSQADEEALLVDLLDHGFEVTPCVT